MFGEHCHQAVPPDFIWQMSRHTKYRFSTFSGVGCETDICIWLARCKRAYETLCVEQGHPKKRPVDTSQGKTRSVAVRLRMSAARE